MAATANPPKSEDGNGQLTRVAFKINDFLRNPYFRKTANRFRFILHRPSVIVLEEIMREKKTGNEAFSITF